MNRKRLLAGGCFLAAVLILSMVGSFIMQSRSAATTEPLSLKDLTYYPFSATTVSLDASATHTLVNELNARGTMGNFPLGGYADMKNYLHAKGYSFSDVDVEIEMVHITGSDELHSLYGGYTYTQWSGEGPNGTKALLAMGVMYNSMNFNDNASIIISTITNTLPPNRMPGVDPYIIWNGEPYFYAQFYWWWNGRILYWNYWWHDSHMMPNWFWGTYWWWHTELFARTVWRPWYWWWWSWYYWRGWYWWSIQWPY